MTPYFLLSRDPHLYQQLARDLNRYSKINTHLQERAPAKGRSLPLSQLISEGAYGVINRVERGWNHAAALLGK